MAKQEEYDIRKIGPLKYKQLQEANRGNYSSEVAWNIKKIRDEHPIVSAYDPDWMTEKQVQSSLYRNSGGKDYWGKSMFDDSNADINEFSRLGDIRAENQPWYAQLGAGLGKMTVLAGTTFVEGTLGLLCGAGTAIAEGRWSGLWDNEITRAMQAINEASEEWMPNYYTEAEQTGPWYKQLGTMNFWADKFIKNLGFSIGAAYGVAALKIPKLVSLLGAGAKTTKATTLLTSGFVSAVSEGSIEAVNNTNDWEKLKVQELDDDYRANIDRRFAPQETALAQEYQKAYEEYHATKGQLVKRGTGDMASYVDPAAEKYEQKVAAIDAKRAKLEMAKQLAFENRHSDEIYTSARDKISEDKEHMGNMDLLANIPILTISNITELGKFYARGLNTARRSGVKIVEEGAEGVGEAATRTATRTSAAAATELEHTAEKEAGKAAVRGASRAGGKAMPKFEGKKMSKGRLTYNITKGALAEGTEEISQKAASVITGDYYSTDVNNFYKSKLDPNAEKETLSWMKSIMRGMNKTINDSSSWEEFFIGALTGAVGVPMFRSTRAADGSKRSPITVEGGAINHYLDAKHDVERSQEIAAYLNKRVQDPNFLNYYRSFIRRAKTQKEMDSALARDDVFDFKNAEYAQFVSDIIMFDSAGKLGMLEDFIGEALDLSDENLENIVRITTRSETDANGKVSQVSPFQGMLDTKEGKEEMKQILTKTEKKMRDTMNKYRKTATNLDTLTNGILNDEQLSELTYLQMQSEEWSERGLEMAPVVKKAINDIIKNIEVEASSLPQKLADAALSPNGSLNEITSIGESYRKIGMTPQRLETLKELAAMKDEDLARVLSSPNNADFARGLATQLALVGSDIISNLDRKNVLKMLMDYPRIGKAQQLYNDKIKEYLERPEKLQEDQAKATEEIVEQTKEGKKQDLRTKLTNAKSVHEFREALNTEDDDEVKRTTLAELEQENNPMAKNYKETTQFDKDIQVQLSNMGLGNQVYNDALALWRNQVGETENLNQMADESSVHLGDDTFFLEDSANDPTVAQTRFQNARYAVQQAMQKVKEDIKYRDRFSPRYETPEGTPTPTRGVTGTTTGDSGVSTVPPTNPTVAPAEDSSVPVGNISSDEVAAENKELNEILADTEETESNSGTRQYWKPQIPELHIKATKDGDFRDFDKVIKEREGKDFSVIYGYLKSNGAFEYLNSGRLKTGDTLGFMIDPLFEEQMSQYDWYEGPTIFFVHGEQVVGDVASLSQAVRFEGLTDLINKVRAEYQASRSGTDTSIAESIDNIISVAEANKEVGDKLKANANVIGMSASVPLIKTKVEQLNTILEKGEFTDEDIAKIDSLLDDIYGALNTLISTHNNGAITNEAEDLIKDLASKIAAKVGSKLDNYAERRLEIIKEKAASQGRSAEINRATSGATMIDGSMLWLFSSIRRFYATPKTKVAKMMVGKIEHGSQERSLNDIPGVMDGKEAPIFGIVKNGRLEVNGKVDPRLILTPNDMSNKEGRLYLLIPNGAGTYSPISVRVKHFNNREFNLNDETVASTEVGKMITAAIEQLANCTNEDDFKEALNALTSVLYKGKLHINWFNGKTGYGIRFTKAEVDSNGEEIYITNEKGERVRKETSIPVFLSSKTDAQGNISVATIGRSGVVEEAEETRVDPETAKKQITNVLLKFNLPIQVRADKINTPGYNERIIESNVTTSNTVSARSRSTWFVTNPIGPDGKLKDAVPPKSVAPKPTPPSAPSPVGGNESIVNGTTISINGVSYIVDLQKMTYVDEKGVQYAQTKDNLNIFAMAWAEKQYGSATEGYNMTDNKVITPQGRVLDRNTGRFLPDSEAQKIKDKIANRGKVADNNAIADKVVADIYENQKKVDKSRTDDTFYYILEEDGEYHKYPRVHTRIGDNWIGPRNDSTERNSKRSLKAGSAVDQIIRDFFSKKTPVRPDNMSEAAFNALIDSLNQVKETIEKNGETFMADNIVLFYKYPDGTRVAGEVDILSRTKDGNFKIYDVKTSSRSFHDSSFTTKSKYQRMSTKDYYTLQLSGYQNLFQSQYSIKPAGLAIFPFVLTYDATNGDTVTSIEKEKGITITYNPNVNVPLAESPVASQQQKSSDEVSTDTTPLIFKSPDSTIKVEDRENDFHKIEGGRVGYYEDENGKVYKGYLKEIGNVDGIPIYITKEAITTDSYGMAEEHVVMNNYIAVFPSGKAVSVLNKVPVTGESAMTDEQAGKRIFDTISQYYKEDPEYVQELAQSETSLSKNQATSSTPAPSAQPTSAAETKPEVKPETKPTTPAEPSGAQKAVQAEKNINKRAAKRMKPKLREKDSTSRKVWNKEKELSWLRKVLPQLSEQDRVKLINGLIQVSENGPYAWGMFDGAIVALSDIAAEGTTYHEAFHVVFNLMLSPQEREALFEEARQRFGNKDRISLEENMAEGFREYVMTQEDRGLGRKILDFFKNLFAKVTHWKYVKPSLNSYYRMINQGKYSRDKLGMIDQRRARQEEYTPEMQAIKDRAIANGTFMKINGKPTNLTERQWLQVRTKAFKDWFGDWQNDPENASKVVDENGEPLVVYHGTLAEFSIFDIAKLGEVTGKGYYIDHITKERIPIDSESTFFFTNNKYAANSYKNLAIYNKNQLTSIFYQNLSAIFSNNHYLFTNLEDDKKLKQKEFIDNVLSPILGFDVRREANKILKNESTLSESQRDYYASKFEDMALKLKNLPDSRAVSNRYNNLNKHYEDLQFILDNKENLISNTEIGRLKEYNISISTNYGNRSRGDVYIVISKEDDGYYATGIPGTEGMQKITDSNFDLLIDEFKRGITQNEEQLNKVEQEGHYNRGYVMEVFLNIKNPNIHDYEESAFPDKYKNTKYPTGYIAARQVRKAKSDNNDGVIYKNVRDPFLMDSYGIFNPNQIKSATSNNGDFSTTNDDIRYRIVPTEEQAKIDETAKAMRKEAQAFLDNFGITFREVKEFGEDRLFDAINRVINIRNADDISEGVGQAIAFMMQHNGLMQELFRYKLAAESTTGAKGIRRSLTKRGDITKLPSITKLEPEVRERLINEVGQDIATQLRKLYNVEPIKVEPKSFLSKLWDIITEFFSKLTPEARTKFNIIKNYTANIANSVKLNDPSIIRTSDVKPGTNVKAVRVDIAKALRENPYEREIIEFLSSNGIALAGSASIALEGTLYRPEENPLHDIDFNAAPYTKESLDTLIKENFPNVSFIREIQDGPDKITETYLTMDREYTTKDIIVRVEKEDKVEEKKAVGLYDKNGEQLGYYISSDLILKEGVKGKFLDFFLGDGNNVYPPRVLTINNKPYLVANPKNAFKAKVTWARPKDIWDYNRFVPAEMFDKIRKQNKEELKRKVQNAKIIWGHPAIGKTTYLERNDDIIEWDAEVNAKRDAFFREQLDPEHKLDMESREYENLRSEYMNTWQSHPEYINFLIKEWTALKKKAEKENKRIFASPAPLMVLFEDDFDLFVALPEKVFLERNKERGGKYLSSMGWKQIINKNLVLVDPNKVVYTDKYFSEFIRDTLGVQWGTLTNEEATALEAKGWTEEMFKRVSQQERDNAVECVAL